MSHTPGTWQVNAFSVKQFGEIWIEHPEGDGKKYLVARAANMGDARVISATPDMVNLLRELAAVPYPARTAAFEAIGYLIIGAKALLRRIEGIGDEEEKAS